MKKSVKILGTIGVLAGLGYLGYKMFKKEKKKILEAEAEDDEIIKDLGINPEYVKEELIPEEDDNNLVKPLFLATYGSPDIDIDFIMGDTSGDVPVVYVMQSTRHAKKGEEDIRNLDIHLEIPSDYEKKGFKMRDLVMGGKRLAKELWSDVIKYVPEPYSSLHGFMVLGLTEVNGKHYQRVFRIPEHFYNSETFTEGSKSNGLEEFVKGFAKRTPEAMKEIYKKLPTWLTDIFPDKAFETINPINAFLTYKISFNILDTDEDKLGINRIGVDVKLGLEAIKHILNEFEIERSDNNWKKQSTGPTMRWERIVFCAPNPDDGRWSFLRYYDKDKEGHVKECVIEWEEPNLDDDDYEYEDD